MASAATVVSKACTGCSMSSSKTICPDTQRPRSQKHGYRASLRAWLGSRQQKRAKRQNSREIRRVEPELPSRTATAQVRVNLDSEPWQVSVGARVADVETRERFGRSHPPDPEN